MSARRPNVSILIGLLIGLILGLTGAGGSIFAVPLLILLLDLPINDAIGIALGAITFSALIGTISNRRAGSILWVPAFTMGVGGVMVAPLGKHLGSLLPPLVLLVGFCLLAVTIAWIMWRQAVSTPEKASVLRSGYLSDDDYIMPICRFSQSQLFDLSSQCIGALLSCGLAVVLLSGLFGVGSGFLVVPALIYITQASVRQAVATSLLIICMVGGSGFIGFVVANQDLDWLLLLKVCAGGLFGMLAGRLIADTIAGVRLQKIFSIALMAVTALTLIRHIKGLNEL